MNVYDFDGTVYDGESTFDFFLYCLARRPKLLRFLPTVVSHLIRYKRCLITREMLFAAAEKYVDAMLAVCPEVRDYPAAFWAARRHKLKPYYAAQRREDDVFISASFGFMLRPACELLGLKEDRLLCSEFDFDTRKVTRLCFRENKPGIFDGAFPNAVIDAFYTDSENDLPMMRRAKSVYLVKKNNVLPYTVPSAEGEQS